MPSPTLLQTTLSSNAGFSAASGLVLLAVPEAIGSVIGVDVDWFLRLFGVALLAHAALLWFVVGRTDVARWAKLNLAAIAPYPVAMMAVAATVADAGAGRALVLADGAAIAIIAGALAMGLRRGDGAIARP